MEQWQEETVLYQIYPKSFCDGNGDGIGDLAGILSKVPYLKALGVNAVWLSPCFPSPGVDNGYDISDYRDIAPEYGTLDDFRVLLRTLHENGIRLLLDLVVNHTSDEHMWFRESRKSRNSSYRDYYIWRDPVNGGEPNGWQAGFGGSAWKFDEQTGQYYLHLYAEQQPDLNWDNPKVRREIADMINFWLDMGVDGFRCDVIHSISKDFNAPFGGGIGPHLHEYLHELYGRTFGPHGALTVGETWGLTPQQALLLTGENRGELTAAFQFEHLSLGRENGDKFSPCSVDREAFVDILAKWEDGLKAGGFPVLVMENHDQPRALSRFGDVRYPVQSATMLAVLLYGMRGMPVIYQGQELGLENPVFTDIEQYRDIETIEAYRQREADFPPDELLRRMNFGSRDNARAPMPWADCPGSGFTEGTPWIAAEYKRGRSVREQENDPESVLSFYRRFLQLRARDAVLLSGDFTLLQNKNGTVVYRRALSDEQRIIVCRFCDTEAPLPKEAAGETLLGNYPGAPDMLRPYEARIVRR